MTITIESSHPELSTSQILHAARAAIENPRAVYLPDLSAVAYSTAVGSKPEEIVYTVHIRREDMIVI